MVTQKNASYLSSQSVCVCAWCVCVFVVLLLVLSFSAHLCAVSHRYTQSNTSRVRATIINMEQPDTHTRRAICRQSQDGCARVRREDTNKERALARSCVPEEENTLCIYDDVFLRPIDLIFSRDNSLLSRSLNRSRYELLLKPSEDGVLILRQARM